MPERQASWILSATSQLVRPVDRPDFVRDRRAGTIAAAELAQELASTKLLQSISTQLIEDQPIEALYQCVAAGASTLLRSDFATMQMLDPERSDGLGLIAHRGMRVTGAKSEC